MPVYNEVGESLFGLFQRGCDLGRILILYGTGQWRGSSYSSQFWAFLLCHTAPIVYWEGVLFPAGRREA